MTDLVVLPSSPALLAQYAGLTDPVSQVRAACLSALSWLVNRGPQRIVVLGAVADPANVSRGVTEPLSMRIARSLLSSVGFTGTVEEVLVPGPVPHLTDAALIVVADGSARRGEKTPGHIDERSFAFDDAIEIALRACDTTTLRDLDEVLGAELLAGGVPVLKALGTVVHGNHVAEMDYAGDPFGVQYWVARWTCTL